MTKRMLFTDHLKNMIINKEAQVEPVASINNHWFKIIVNTTNRHIPASKLKFYSFDFDCSNKSYTSMLYENPDNIDIHNLIEDHNNLNKLLKYCFTGKHPIYKKISGTIYNDLYLFKGKKNISFEAIKKFIPTPLSIEGTSKAITSVTRAETIFLGLSRLKSHDTSLDLSTDLPTDLPSEIHIAKKAKLNSMDINYFTDSNIYLQKTNQFDLSTEEIEEANQLSSLSNLEL